MNNMYLVATLYLGVLGIIALFFNLTNFRLTWKIILGLLAIGFIGLSIYYQQKERKEEDLNREHAEFRAERRMDEVRSDLSKLKEKEKTGLFDSTDYLNRLCLELEKLNISIANKGNLIKEQYLTTYFSEMGKIPTFYNWDEWQETEGYLFNRMLDGLRNNFSARGMFQSSIRERVENEFIKERAKYIKAKEREMKAYAK